MSEQFPICAFGFSTPIHADFTILVKDTDAGCWITLRGNRTGTTLQRCVQTRSVALVALTIARLWIKGAKMVGGRA